MGTPHYLRAALAFAVAGSMSRLTFQSFETRWQILIFGLLAFGYQAVVLPALGSRGSAVGFIVDAAASAIAVIAIKILLEGWH